MKLDDFSPLFGYEPPVQINFFIKPLRHGNWYFVALFSALNLIAGVYGGESPFKIALLTLFWPVLIFLYGVFLELIIVLGAKYNNKKS